MWSTTDGSKPLDKVTAEECPAGTVGSGGYGCTLGDDGMSIDEQRLGTHPRSIQYLAQSFFRKSALINVKISFKQKVPLLLLQSAEPPRRRASVPAPSREEASAGGAAAGRAWRHGT